VILQGITMCAWAAQSSASARCSASQLLGSFRIPYDLSWCWMPSDRPAVPSSGCLTGYPSGGAHEDHPILRLGPRMANTLQRPASTGLPQSGESKGGLECTASLEVRSQLQRHQTHSHLLSKGAMNGSIVEALGSGHGRFVRAGTVWRLL